MRIKAMTGWASLAAMSAVAVLMSSGCDDGPRTHSQRVDANSDDSVEGTGIGSADVSACTSKWVPGIMGKVYKKDWAEPPHVAMLPATNRTSQQFDGKMITNKMMTNLFKAADDKLVFMYRDNMEEILAERERKREGVVSSSGKKALGGVDYYITLTITASTTRRGPDESNYVLMTAVMFDAESSQMIWTDEYEFKKVGTRGAMSR